MSETASPQDPAPVPECFLEAGPDGVRFAVNGVVRQTMPPDAYEALYARLSAGLDLNQVPVDTGRGVIHFRLSPLDEIRRGRVMLTSEDAAIFSRRYAMTALQASDEGKSVAVLTDAATGSEVARVPWPEMARLAKSGACRGATRYADMLGAFSGRLYFEATGEIYAPPRATPDAADEPPPSADVAGRIAVFRHWIGARPALAWVIAAVGLAFVLISFFFFLYQPVRTPGTVDLGNARSVDNFIEEHALIADCLRGVDLNEYARKHPQALQGSLHRLETFLIRIERAKLTPRQSARVETIRQDLRHLQQAAGK